MFTPPTEPRTKMVSGYITRPEYDELAEVAERYGLTLSSAVHQCIAAGLEAERQSRAHEAQAQSNGSRSQAKLRIKGGARATTRA